MPTLDEIISSLSRFIGKQRSLAWSPMPPINPWAHRISDMAVQVVSTVGDLQQSHLSTASTGGIESHEQDAMKGRLCLYSKFGLVRFKSRTASFPWATP
jgi:hypothetical protein